MTHYAVSSRNAKKTLLKPGVTSSTLCSWDVIKLSVGIAHSALVLFFPPVAVSLLCYQQHHFLENCGKLLLLFFML